MLLFSLNLLVKFLDVSVRCQYFLSCQGPFASFFFFRRGSACFSSSILLSASPSAPHRLCPPLSLLPPCFLPWPASSSFLHLITFPHGICPSITLCDGISTGCVGNTCWCWWYFFRFSVILPLSYSYSFSTHRQGVVKFSLHAFYLSWLRHQ